MFMLFSCESDDYLAVDSQGRTVVERFGQLSVIGTNLCKSDGTPVQLHGMSSHGLQWHGNTEIQKYYNGFEMTGILSFGELQCI